MKDKLNPRAAVLCRNIETIQDSFLSHRLKSEKYTPEERVIFVEVKSFFSLRQDFDLFVLCYFIMKKISGDAYITLKDLVRHFKLNLEGCVNLNTSLRMLTRKSYILAVSNRQSSGEYKYCLTWECLNSILKYDKKNLKRKGVNSFRKFLKMIDPVMEDRDPFNSRDKLDALADLTEEYSYLPEIKWLRQQKLSSHGIYFLVNGAKQLLFEGEKYFDLIKLLFLISDIDDDVKFWESDFLHGNNELIKGGYLTFEPGPFKGGRLCLTSKSMDGLRIKTGQTESGFYPNMFTLTRPEDINEDFYIHNNPDLELIEKMVSRDNYETIKSRVQGLTILLTGAPGVGKTSFLKHLAKTTGRVLLSADIASILDLYVGESEKNLKKLFTEAGNAFRSFDVTPVCVFDEAESLLYRRNPKAVRSVEHMNNNMISILLQCLDSFRGILIFCSNFSFEGGSFDPAIHRRLHIISEVKSPSQRSMAAILRHHFPGLTPGKTSDFLKKYPFITPAQIKNLRNKYEVKLLLDKEADPEKSLYESAEKDLKLFVKSNRPIGFKINTPCGEC